MGGAISPDPTGANDGIGDDAKAPIGPVGDRLIPQEDDSGTNQNTPRRALVIALENAAIAAIAVGDVALVRLALETLAALAAHPEQPTIESRVELPGHR